MDKAQDILIDQIPAEISAAHNALATQAAITHHAVALRDLPCRGLFGCYQRHALDVLVLSVCKLFERPSQKYPNFSIPTALRLLNDDVESLAVPFYNIEEVEKFIQREIDSTFSRLVHGAPASAPQLLVTYFDKICPRTPPRPGNELDSYLEGLRVLRDKRIAHREDHDLNGLATTDMEGVQKLLAFAQTFVSVVGFSLYELPFQGIVSPSKFAPVSNPVWLLTANLLKQLCPNK